MAGPVTDGKLCSPAPLREGGPTLTSCPGVGKDPHQGACLGPELCVHQQGVCWWKGLSNLGVTALESRGETEAAAWPLPGTPMQGSASPHTDAERGLKSHNTKAFGTVNIPGHQGPSLVLLPPRAFSWRKSGRIRSSSSVFKAHPLLVFLSVQHLAAGGSPGARLLDARSGSCKLPRTQDDHEMASQH